jgi:DNA polymerase III delta prime subunit
VRFWPALRLGPAFVIDDADLMTEQASNALLKSLEEPPPTSHVFLVTASPQALLPTIRSRCQTLRFSGLPLGVIETHLRESPGIPAEEAHLRAHLSGGSLRAALDFEHAYRASRLGSGAAESRAGLGPGQDGGGRPPRRGQRA